MTIASRANCQMSRFRVMTLLMVWTSPAWSFWRSSRQRVRRATTSRQVSVGSPYASGAGLFQPSRLETSLHAHLYSTGKRKRLLQTFVIAVVKPVILAGNAVPDAG